MRILPSHIPVILDKLGLSEGWTDRNSELWMPCPLPYGNHKNGDKNASFSINLDTGKYNCFVCGGGGIVGLAMAVKGLSHDEAVEWIAGLINHNEDHESFRERILLKAKTLEYDQKRGNLEPAVFDEWVVPEICIEDPRFLDYLEEENITAEAAKHFRLSLDPELPGVYIPHIWKGKPVGWQKRDLNPEEERIGPKYKNTPKFPKRNTLFNYDSVVGQDEVIVVEAPKTAIVMWGLGIKNVVATFGAEVNPEQMQALWGFPRVLLWFDNDKAGKNAIHTAAQYLKDVCDVWVVTPVNIEKGDAADLPPEEVEPWLANNTQRYLRYKLNEKIHNK